MPSFKVLLDIRNDTPESKRKLMVKAKDRADVMRLFSIAMKTNIGNMSGCILRSVEQIQS
jgi:hypothetical protein